ncbi:MAG: hypothetical protein FWC41_09110, partial [Firmicutes bacterium]|nr:hypothetical protein [Bacillota bacterium]
MKKIFFLTLLAAIFVIAGCKKEEMIKGVGKNSGSTFKSAISSELEMLYQQLPPVNFGNITLLNGD